jgi:hypothetical protein
MKKSSLVVSDLAKSQRLPRTIKDVELKTMVTGARPCQGGTCSSSEGGDCDE